MCLGATVLHVCISREGVVEKVTPIAGPAALRETVMRTVMLWRYRPYLVDGVAVPVASTVTVNVDFGGE
jgi:hypothetical protein